MVHDLLPIHLVFQVLEPVWWLKDSVVNLQARNAEVIEKLKELAIQLVKYLSSFDVVAISEVQNDLILLHLVSVILQDVVLVNQLGLLFQDLVIGLVGHSVHVDAQVGVKCD